jgi:hypothetical protein
VPCGKERLTSTEQEEHNDEYGFRTTDGTTAQHAAPRGAALPDDPVYNNEPLMRVTALSPVIGYDKASTIAQRRRTRGPFCARGPQERLHQRCGFRPDRGPRTHGQQPGAAISGSPRGPMMMHLQGRVAGSALSPRRKAPRNPSVNQLTAVTFWSMRETDD